MPKILFLTVHRPDRSPSQRFRFEQYLESLKSNGFDYDFSFLLNEKDDKIYYSKGHFFKKSIIVFKSFFKRFHEIFKAKNYDLIFIQRECFMLGTSFFEKQFSKTKVPLVFDFDDSIWLQNVSEANKTFVWLKNPKKTAKIIGLSKAVIAGNIYLNDYAKQFTKNSIIIPTTIDTNEYVNTKKTVNNKITIGWSGSITTIKHFEFAIGVLKKILNKYPDKICIKVIGDANYFNSELNIKGIAWNKKTEIEDLSEFDIGIMPLPNDEWAKGKCGLKGLQYMALEIPTIMSPVGVNVQIIENGVNGFLANSEKEWVDYLSLLIESHQLREQIGKQGRATVLNKYSVIANKEKYLMLFTNLLNKKGG